MKSRRRRNESPSKQLNRTAFRLCIAAEDQDKLLNDASWPDSVTISDWYFKQSDKEKRPRLEVEAVGEVVVHNQSDNQQESTMIEIDDNTLTSADHSQDITAADSDDIDNDNNNNQR